MGFLKDRIWSWGYVLNFVPGAAPFTFGKSRCSLETQAKYLGAERCFYMNSMFSREYVEKSFIKSFLYFAVILNISPFFKITSSFLISSKYWKLIMQ